MIKKTDLLTIDELSESDIFSILKKAMLLTNKDWQIEGNPLVANLFFEDSTRTHYSFSSAENSLGLKILEFNAGVSSVNKGESLYDTCKTFESIGAKALVIRHKKNEYYKELEGINIPIINAGDGTGNHPTQCLLDLLTIYQEFGSFKGLNVLIVGDISHSRVAHSDLKALTMLGATVKYSGPKQYCDDLDRYVELDEGIKAADVVMLLRIQYERDEKLKDLLPEEYLAKYGLTIERYNMMKGKAIIMHPAPVNRGVEIDSSLVEAPKSRIFKQMENGVQVRKAVLIRSLCK